MAKRTKSGFSAKKIIMLAAAVFLFSAVVSMLVTANYGNNRAAYFLRDALTARGTVEDGVPPIEGIDPLEDVAAGEIRYNINNDVYFPNGYAMGDVLLHNPQSSSYALQFKFYLADGSSNVPAYISPVLQPGQYISGDKLNRYLPAGKYECTYSVAAFAPDDLTKQVGTASGYVNLSVVC